jgi:hypothetical protein
MNHSIATADNTTHLKIAALALIAAIVVVIVGFSARVDNLGIVSARVESNGPAIKAGKATLVTTRSGFEIR